MPKRCIMSGGFRMIPEKLYRSSIKFESRGNHIMIVEQLNQKQYDDTIAKIMRKKYMKTPVGVT